MYKITVLFCLLLIFVFFCPHTFAYRATSVPATASFLVKFTQPVTEQELRGLYSGFVSYECVANLGSGTWYVLTIGTPELEKARQQLKQDTRVVCLEDNGTLNVNPVFSHGDNICQSGKTIHPNDPLYPYQWGEAKIRAHWVWSHKGSDATGVIVAVVDTGVQLDHPDIAANLWQNPGEIPGNNIDDDNNGYVDDVCGYNFINNSPDATGDHFHGTWVSSIIASVGNNGIGTAGLAWKASILPVKFLNAQGSGTFADAAKSLMYCIAIHRQTHIPMVINCSWGGGTHSQAVADVLQEAEGEGILVCCAAGNDARPEPVFPGSLGLDNMICVAATDQKDKLAYFSCYSPTLVDLAAPGVNIVGAVLDSKYDSFDGTSASTPFVTAVAALLWSHYPTKSCTDIKNAIVHSVTPIKSLQDKVKSGGRLNAKKAFRFLHHA